MDFNNQARQQMLYQRSHGLLRGPAHYCYIWTRDQVDVYADWCRRERAKQADQDFKQADGDVKWKEGVRKTWFLVLGVCIGGTACLSTNEIHFRWRNYQAGRLRERQLVEAQQVA